MISGKNVELKNRIKEVQSGKAKAKELLNVFSNHRMARIVLEGQKTAPEAFADLIWDQEKKRVFIDAKDLPDPPQGKVYQVWSITLNPLKPTSIGLLKGFRKNKLKIFELDNPNDSKAFGITLEPAGGSTSPSMDQLYVLGTVKTKTKS